MMPALAIDAARSTSLTGSPVVAACDLTRRYGKGETTVDALRGVSLAVTEGTLVAVMGPSGSGKSTLMHVLAGLDRPTQGDVWIDGTQIGNLGDTDLTKLRRRHIGFIFQFFNLLPMLSAGEALSCRFELAGRKPDRVWVDELIAKVGLGDRRTHRPSELSGGQQQRVAIAHALVSKPTVVFADEPTGNLDSTTSGEILDLLRDSVSIYGQTTVMVTHDPRAATIADRILFLTDGRIVKELGRSTRMRCSPRFREARPAAAVDRERRQRLTRAGLDYLRKLKNPKVKVRFDIVEVLLNDGAVREVRHLPNSFAMERPYRYG